MSPLSYLNTHELNKCSGCGACANVCAKNAIAMTEDKAGFLYPSINTDKCIGCGLCEKVCPYNVDVTNNASDNQKAYFVASDNKAYFYHSATAGFCTAVAREVIRQGGLAYGVYLDEDDWKAKHICVTDCEGTEKIRNSKYLQSETSDTYSKVKDSLNRGIRVLYTGTPCQIAGLKAFLRKDYENLITIDIICHGVFSYRLVKEEVKYWETFYNGTLSNLKFRSKRIYPHPQGGIVNFDIIKGKKSKHHEVLARYSPTYRSYAYSGDGINHNLRLSCYTCQFRDHSRYGDFTVGDPWQIDMQLKDIHTPENIRNGISLVLSNTEKANLFLESVCLDMMIREIDRSKVFIQPALNTCDRQVPNTRDYIYNKIGLEPYVDIINKALGINIKTMYIKHLIRQELSKIKRQIYGLVK